MKGQDRKIDIMGIVNITDDSYFEASRCLGPNGVPDIGRTISRIGNMISQGATIIDIGACSTRPGARPVGEEEEWRRLAPVIKAAKKEFPDISLSIDTYWASVAEKACNEAGRIIVNDISAGEDDPAMLETAGRLGLGYIAMHKRGSSLTMQQMCSYQDVTEEVLQYFRDFSQKADKAGIKDWILDPGFGFAKDIEQNYSLLKELGRFKECGRRILVGVSRKSMIYRLFGITPEESLPQTQVLHFAALQNGADILRVHDVEEAVRTVALYRKL